VFDLAASRRIRTIVLDVDGVQTDNGLYLGMHNGVTVECKRFNIQDGLGHALLRGTGIEIAWLSGRQSAATTARGAELGVAELLQVPPDAKVTSLTALLERKGLAWDQVAYVGDDLPDIPVMVRVGLPIAVANARAEVIRAARHVTEARGGDGAVREVIERLLKSRGEYDSAVERYLAGAGAA
jgi:3-deoxy-D-manno-octulosonate 8-phosphate phosphatase (KDO 8-P phosphatase)